MSDTARYRRVFEQDWFDPRFRRLDDHARIVALYVKAGPQTTSCGCFRLSTARAVEDHIVPIRQGGAIWDPQNHLSLCLACNTWKANVFEKETIQ
jgi:5-methylcytosine-specific restriction endonuclease McrA